MAPRAVTLNMTCVRRMPCQGGTPVYMPHSSTPAQQMLDLAQPYRSLLLDSVDSNAATAHRKRRRLPLW